MFYFKAFLLFYTALLKSFIYSKITVSYILHGATIPVPPTINLRQAISNHYIMIRKKFPLFQIIYYQPKRKI